MSYFGDTDSLIRKNLNPKGQISPAYLASLLLCTRSEAKKLLEQAQNRGIVRPLPNGWYEMAGLSAPPEHRR